MRLGAVLLTAVFALSCAGSGGSPSAPDDLNRGRIQVTVASTGAELDPDGYLATLDEGSPRPIQINGSIIVDDLLPGTHQISLQGIAANCAVQGASSRTVTVSAGATATVAFAVVCETALATIRVSINTSGPLPDPNGYLLALDTTPPRQVAINETVDFQGQSLTAHSLSLSGLEPNCQVSGDNPRTVTVSHGGITDVTFAVQCRSLTGSIHVVTSTTGPSPDPDGYTLILDGGDPRSLQIQDAVLLVELSPGMHDVVLMGTARNCSVEGGTAREIEVELFLQSEIVFEVVCPSTVQSVDLDLPGGTARAIDDVGEVVGGSVGRAFFWSPAGLENLGPGDAWDLNDSRVVVGVDDSRAVVWFESGTAWSRVLLPPFQDPVLSGAFNDFAMSIDPQGQTGVGQSSPDMGRSGGQPVVCQVPVVWRRAGPDWSSATVEVLPALDRGGSICNGFGSGLAIDINATGMIVGVTPTFGVNQPVVWSGGPTNYTVEVLPLPPLATGGVAWAVNGMGDIAGYVETPGGRVGVLWRRIGGSWDPQILGRDEALGINDLRTVVGEVSQPLQLGWFWSSSSGLQSTALGAARDVNDSGQIAGEAEGRPVIWQITAP